MRHLAVIIATFILAAIAGVLSLARNDWFGEGDLPTFLVATMFFSVCATIPAAILRGLTDYAATWVAVMLAFIGGISYGFLGAMGFMLLLGPWAGAMSIPVLQPWCVAAAVVFTSASILHREPNPARVATRLMLLAVVTIAASFVIRPALALLTGAQRVDIVLLHLREPSPTLQILGEPYGIEESDLELLKQAGVTGAFEVSGSSGENHRLKWPKAKALIVSTGPLQDGTALPQPKACSVVYVQEGKTFRSFPADVPTNSRRVLIRHEPPEQWFLEFERSDGGVTGTSFRN